MRQEKREELEGFTLDDLTNEENKSVVSEWINEQTKKKECISEDKQEMSVVEKIDDYLLEHDIQENGFEDDKFYNSDNLEERLEFLSNPEGKDFVDFYSLIEDNKKFTSKQKQIFSLMEKFKRGLMSGTDEEQVLFMCKLLLLKQAIYNTENQEKLMRIAVALPYTLTKSK